MSSAAPSLASIFPAAPHAESAPAQTEAPLSADPARCDHCGLIVPASLLAPAAPHQFCCAGCRAVFELLHGCGLERYYRLRDTDSPTLQPARVSGHDYREFDDPTFHRLYAHESPDTLRTVELFLEGVHCGACVWLVERLPRLVPFVVEARLDFRRALVRLTWDPVAGKLSDAAKALDSLGYPPHPARDAVARDLRRREDRALLIRIGVAGACAGNVMMLAFALYSGFLGGIEAQFEQLFRWSSMLIGLLALAWPGRLFFRGAWAAIRTRTAHLDLPIALGLAAGGIAGTANTILGRGEIYFDSLTVLVFLLLVGRAIQRRQQRTAADAVELLYSLTPSVARRVETDAIRSVPIEALQPRDLVEVRAGETIPVDGIVESGASSVDQSLLSGESTPRDVAVGSEVCAGTTNVAASLRVRAVDTGEQTRVGRLMQLLECSARRQAPMVRAADRVAGCFTIAMLTLAGLTFALWLRAGLAPAIDNAMALLLVCCPCALGLATPLIVTVAIGQAARRRILIKGGETLEALSRPGTLYLDKTGTITEGRVRMLEWYGPEYVKPFVAAVERHSAHPLASAFVEAFAEHLSPPASDVVQTVGAGIVGTVCGRRMQIGSFALLDQVKSTPQLRARAEDFARQGHTTVIIAMDGVATAVAAFGDRVRDDARVSLQRLKRQGWAVGILSGDHPLAVSAVARQLGLTDTACLGAQTPENKLAAVQLARAHGPVMMVGDGVNDAAALAAATVGVAVHGGAEASLAAAHVYLNQPGLAPLVELFTASRRTSALIHRSFAISIAYNALAAGLAMAGVLNPLIAAVLMPISSFTVLTLALTGRAFRESRCP